MMRSFKEQYPSYRVVLDPTPDQSREGVLWREMIPGKNGHVYHFGFDGTLGAWVEGCKLIARFSRNLDFKVHVRASTEAIFLFDPRSFDFVAKSLKLKKRRILSERQLFVLKNRQQSFGVKRKPFV